MSSNVKSIKAASGQIAIWQKRVAFATVVLLLGLGLGVIWPLRVALAKQRVNLASEKRQLDEAVARASQLPQLKQHVEALRDRLGRYKSLRPRSELADALSSIAEQTQRLGVSGHKMTPSAGRRIDQSQEHLVKLQFDGRFEQVWGLVNSLETGPQLGRVRDLTVKRKADGTLATDLTLSLYFTD